MPPSRKQLCSGLKKERSCWKRGKNTTVTRCCVVVGVGVGVGVGQAIDTKVVCWIKTSLHRLPARGTPRDRES